MLQLHYLSLLVFIDQRESEWTSIKQRAELDGLLDSPERACPALGALRAARVPLEGALYLEVNAVYAELVASFHWVDLAHSRPIEMPFRRRPVVGGAPIQGPGRGPVWPTQPVDSKPRVVLPSQCWS